MDVNSRDPLQNIIPFRIKGVEISRFDSSGNLKIGTTTTTAPTVRLDISGGEARVNSGSAASTALTTTGRIGINVAAPTTDLDVSGAARLTASSATATALTTTGRIGVNMAAPSVDLDVAGAARVTASSATATALTTVGRIGVNTAAPTVALEVIGVAVVTGSSATATALTTTGRIGVNTAAPSVDLDVVGAVRVTTSSATATALTTTGRIGVNTTTPGTDLDISGVARVSASSATATALTTTGRIGVNMAAPTVALDVSGEGNILTGLTIGSSSVGVNGIESTYNSKLAIYHSTEASMYMRYGGGTGLLIGNVLSASYFKHLPTTGEIALICEQNVPIKFKTNTAVANTPTRMTITGAGNVGIGTDAPTVALDVNGIMRSNTGLKLGNAATTAMTGDSILDVENIGIARARFTSGTNIFTIGTHSNNNTSAPSESFIYNETSTPMTFGTNGNERMRILADGKVGIGTTTPQYPVDIHGFITTQSSVNSYWWGVTSAGTGINTENIFGAPISMRLNGSVWIESTTSWVGFWATSDRRIKKNINYNISSECLNLFRQLKCSNYSYIDERANKTNVYGYIAQDVSTVIPYAVTTQKGFIPSLYSLAKISKENGIVKLTCYEQKTYTFHSLHDNQGKAFTDDNNEPASDKDGGRHFKVKLYDISMNEYIVRINEILDNGVFTIENDDVSIKLTHEEYFVFGQEIDDYKILNNEAIAIVATAALQEVDRQQQADKARIAELEATVASQQSLINDILERLKTNGL